MVEVFLSYRRADTRADAGRLYDRLAAHYGEDRVFMDVDDIDPGENFVQVLESTLDRCNVLLILIGPRWQTSTEDGTSRLADAGDFVRMEIERAIERGIRIIPILVGGAQMPSAHELPASLARLAQQQAFLIQDARFHPDVDQLIEFIGAEHERRTGLLSFVTRHRFVVLTLLVFLAASAWLAVVRPLQQAHRRDTAVASHLSVAERFVVNGRLDTALAELDAAARIDPNRVSVLRRSVFVVREQLERRAFADGQSTLHVGLQRNYERLRPVNDQQLDAALARVYRLFAAEPSLENDVDVLLQQALILRLSGGRVDEAMAVLRRAVALAPRRADLLAELGVLQAVVKGDRGGIAQLSEAVAMAPANPRARLYLAQALSEAGQCAQAGESMNRKMCSEALDALQQCIAHSQAEDLWSRHMRVAALRQARDIFSRVATEADDILSGVITLPNDERLRWVELLLASDVSGSVRGWSDDPVYWQARLYEAVGDTLRAGALLRAHIEERGISDPPPAWRALLQRVTRVSP